MPASFLFEMALKASIVVLLALAVTRLMSAWSSAATRHVVWMTAIGGIVLLPVLMLVAPAWRVALVPTTWAARADAVLRLSTRASRLLGSADVWPTTAGVASHAPIDPSDKASTSATTRIQATSSSSFAWARRPTWLVLLVGLWAAGTLLATLRLLVGLVWAQWLVRTATLVVAPDWLAVKDEVADRIGSTRDVSLRTSDRIGVPVACGIVRPSILLPPQADSWDEPRRKIVLLHELAHVRRRDCLAQVLAQTAKAIHWFNPLALVAVARLHREQERACDDVVLTAGAPASDYADHLCEIVRTARIASAPPWAVLTLARPSRLHERVLAILDERLSRRSPSRRFCLSLVVVACVGLIPIGAIRPSASMEAMTLLPSVAFERMGPPASLTEFGRPIVQPSTAPNAPDVDSGQPTATGSGPRPPVLMGEADARGFVSSYCTSCHNDQQKAAGLSLAAFGLATSPDHPELGEKIVRRLRAGVHPPPESPRPDRAGTEAFSASVEAAIDRADRANWGPDLVELITDRELAIRLAKFLWNSEPDGELFQVASAGSLRDASELQRQIRRMLADSRLTAMFTAFFGQWLRTDKLGSALLDAADFDPGLRDAFGRELDLFLASQVREDHSAIDLLTANYSFVNERLAQHYGIANITGSQFRRVMLADDTRFGLLGKGGILSVTSFSNRTLAVVRGKYVLETLLGVAPPAPPANVPALKALGPDDPPMSMRQRLAVHHSNPVCANCHSQIDAFGFALENFDHIGGWRTVDGTPIDASGRLADGTEFDGPSGVRRVLVDRKDLFVSTVTLRLLAYALNRPAKYADMPTVRAILRDTATNRYRWSSLILSLVQSTPFQTKPRVS